MIKLIQNSSTEYTVRSEHHGVNTSGNILEAFEALLAMGVEPEEIDMARDEMVKNEHQIATFGVDRRFILTEPYEDRPTTAVKAVA